MDEIDVQQRARAFVAGVDMNDIHNDLSAYVDAANAKMVNEELDDGESGYTVTKPNGEHVITVNSLETEERRRFTVCHEIAHIVLDLPSSHDEVPSWSYAKRDPNEILCDAFAAELLMPYQMWKAQAPMDEPSVEVIQRLAQKFRTSFPATASRYASLADIPCGFVTMERGLIRYAARSTALRRLGAWIPPRSPIPEGSVAHRLRTAGTNAIETDEVSQDIWFQEWEKGLDLWEMARHYHRSDTAVALLWFSPDDLPDVEVTRFGVRIKEEDGLEELTGELPWPGKSRRK